jgi:hypothetical protein
MEPILYIIMRTDIPDMNPGKLAAQAAHVASDFEHWVRHIEAQADQYSELLYHISEWRRGAISCGTTICLSATEDEINKTIDSTGFSGGFVDPTYPWRNYYGDLFLTEELTGAWFFICDENSKDLEILKTFNLHR